MRCETSFFSLTLFQKHLKRYWPLWAVWLAGWTLALPVNLWNEAQWGGVQGMTEDFANALSATSVLIAVMAPLVAVCVYFHLFKGPAANFVGALPIRREGVFATAFAAGYIMLAAPLVVVVLLTLLVEWAVGAVAVGALMELLGGCLLQCFFWLSFATLCCVISGNGVASVCFYTIFNGLVIGMTMLLQNVLSAFLYGFSEFSERVNTAVLWLTPIGMMSQSEFALDQLTSVSRMEVLWVYAAVGFLMLLAALGLHHIRRSERAGDLIAFNAIRWVFRISVTLCGGLTFGLLLMVLIFDGRAELRSSGATLAICCAIAAMVSWFAAEMLLQKSFRVFKGHWKGAVIGAVCFILAICAIDMDWIGFTTRVPTPDQVKSATAVFAGRTDPIASDGLVYDKDTVADVIALHQYLVDHRDEGVINQGEYYCRLEVEYDLGLTHLRREYAFWRDQGDELDRLSAAAQLSGEPTLYEYLGTPADVYVNLHGDDDHPGLNCTLTPVQAQAAWQAILEDYHAGRYRADDPMGKNDRNYINLEWIDKGHQVHWQSIYVRPSAPSTTRFLDELRSGTYGDVDLGDREFYPEDTEMAEVDIYNAQYEPLEPVEEAEESQHLELAPGETLPPEDAPIPDGPAAE